jgi:hypothetical protein
LLTILLVALVGRVLFDIALPALLGEIALPIVGFLLLGL